MIVGVYISCWSSSGSAQTLQMSKFAWYNLVVHIIWLIYEEITEKRFIQIKRAFQGAADLLPFIKLSR